MQVPCLLQLKRCPNVVFAGVDNPEDITACTYQELFHTGGFVVSDNEVLEMITLGESRCGLSCGGERAVSAAGLLTPSKNLSWVSSAPALVQAILALCLTPQTPSRLWVQVRVPKNI